MRLRRWALLGLAGALLVGACGSGSDNSAVVGTTLPPTTVATTAAPTTTLAPTSTLPRLVTAPVTEAPTTAAPVTEAPAPALPQPVPPPAPDASEATVPLGTLEIPKLGLSVGLYEGITIPTLDQGPGHWPGTAMPGEFGNVVVAGHRVSKSRPFRNIDRLVEGDQVLFTVGDQVHTYEVTGHDIVTPEAIYIVEQTPGYTATLFACHPPGSVDYRWVVRLQLVA